MTFDDDGNVLGASGVLTLWFLKFDDISAPNEVAYDPVAEDWEDQFISIVLGDDQPEGLPEGTELFALSGKRF